LPLIYSAEDAYQYMQHGKENYSLLLLVRGNI
jgi:hypothetical protein